MKTQKEELQIFGREHLKVNKRTQDEILRRYNQFLDLVQCRLEYFREELRAERISYAELAELQKLAPYIEKSDVELLEAAGVPQNHDNEN